jgi:hypothetical protein
MTSLAALAFGLFAAASPPLQTTPACTSRSTGGVGDGPAVNFEQVANAASAIAEATVQSVVNDPPPTGPGSPIRRDHVVFMATRVIKGPDSLALFTVSQIGAAGLFEMRPGQRYILFLTADNPRLPVSPERPDLPRYGLGAGGRISLCIEAGKVWVNRNGEAIRPRFDGVDLEKAVADIQAYLKAGPSK